MTSRSTERASSPKDSGERGPGTPPPSEKAIRSDHSPELGHGATGGLRDCIANESVLLAAQTASPGLSGAGAQSNSLNIAAQEPSHVLISHGKGHRPALGAATALPPATADVEVGPNPSPKLSGPQAHRVLSASVLVVSILFASLGVKQNTLKWHFRKGWFLLLLLSSIISYLYVVVGIRFLITMKLSTIINRHPLLSQLN